MKKNQNRSKLERHEGTHERMKNEGYIAFFRWIRKIQSIAIAEDSYLKNPGTEPLCYDTLGDVIAQTVDKYPGRIAVKSVHEDVTVNYEQLLKQVR